MKILNCPFIKQIRTASEQKRQQKMTVCYSDTDNHLNQVPGFLTGYVLVNGRMKIHGIKELQQLCWLVSGRRDLKNKPTDLVFMTKLITDCLGTTPNSWKNQKHYKPKKSVFYLFESVFHNSAIQMFLLAGIACDVIGWS